MSRNETEGTYRCAATNLHISPRKRPTDERGVFPERDIRLVAVLDTTEGENELVPIRSLFNKCRDIGKKRRIWRAASGSLWASSMTKAR